MKKLIVKQKIGTMALILLLALSAILITLPAVVAQFPPPPSGPQSIKTYCYLGAIPNPVGVNQQVLLHVGITEPLNAGHLFWANLTVIVENPDNTTTILGPVNTDSTGGTGLVFVPDQVGTYYLSTHFPGQWYNFSSFTFS